MNSSKALEMPLSPQMQRHLKDVIVQNSVMKS